MKRSVALLSVIAASALVDARAFGQEHAHWTYGTAHTGPASWAELNPDFAACGVGKHQSPIDIKGAKKADLPPIKFGYQPGQPAVVNNGHTVQVTLPPGSSITVGDHTYELAQFHFHTPSEEAISGKRAPLVAHFVHKDAEGKIAVVAVLFDVGAENAALAPIFANMPTQPETDVALAEVKLDPAAVLPAKRGYYEFEGSLTTPPCTEGVRWLVLQQHATISKAQLATFQKLYPNNARPLQPLNGRTIHASK